MFFRQQHFLSRRNDAAPSRQRSGRFARRGQSLVEFAVVALVVYMLLAAILTFGHALYVAQGLQTAADLGAREISRTPLPAKFTFEDALSDDEVEERIYSENFLVFDLDSLDETESFFEDVVPTWPLLNQQLATMMIVDGGMLRYPGALLSDPDTPTGFTVAIPIVSRDGDGVESIRLVPVVEEIKPDASASPFAISSPQRGIVALRINYPFQSASMSSFRPNPAGPFEPTIGSPNLANEDDSVTHGTHAGAHGLGVQQALGQRVRPYRRVISAQAIYRREVFSN